MSLSSLEELSSAPDLAGIAENLTGDEIILKSHQVTSHDVDDRKVDEVIRISRKKILFLY